MIAATEVYETLYSFTGDLLQFDVQVSHTYDSKGNHMFTLRGHISGIGGADPFEPLSSFVSEFEPDDIQVCSAVKGTVIKFKFNADRIEGTPEKQTSYDRIEPREAEVGTVRECTNCRASTYGLHRPPITIRYPSSEFKSTEEEIHDLCVDCSPGHFDDVTRRVEYFGIKENEVSIVAFDNADGIEEFDYTEVDNPYVEDVVEAINNYILHSE